MKTLIIILLFLLAAAIDANSQSKVETIANFGFRAADAAQTCWNLQNTPHWREHTLPTQNCPVAASLLMGDAVGSYLADRWLVRHGHRKLAHLQLVSAGGSALGIAITFTGRPYR